MRQQLPEKLARYEFKKLLPERVALPAPDAEYYEMEAAKAFGYRWSEWLMEHSVIKAKLVAHEMVKGMRQSYEWEQRGENAARPREEAPWEKARRHFFR